MFEELSKLKTPEEWGKHQFKAGLLSWFSWYRLGEQHYLTSKILMIEYWNANNELHTTYRNVTGFSYGTKEFEALQKTYFYEPATLFLALSFENFLKGIWIRQNGTILSETESLPNLLKTHDLNKLAKKCEMKLSEVEIKMLNVLTLFSIWRGKYIIPTNQEKNIQFYESGVNLTFILNKYPGEFGFPDEVKTLRTKISDKLNIPLL